MIKKKPLVSVIMAVYNGEQYVLEAIKSILNQTYQNIEFIVVDDGSTDNSVNVINSISDPKLKVIENHNNRGLASSLNVGIKHSNGDFIARMDADDVSEPNRLQTQVDFLLKNQNVSVCGTWLQLFGEKNNIQKYPEYHNDIVTTLLFNCPFAHPSVMYRASIFDDKNNLYESGRKRVEDYELWYRLSKKYRFANIPIPLLRYRTYKSVTKTKNVFLEANKIRKNILRDFGLCITDSELLLHNEISTGQFSPDYFFLKKSSLWMKKLYRHNCITLKYDNESLTKIIMLNWITILNKSDSIGFLFLKEIIFFNIGQKNSFFIFMFYIKEKIKKRFLKL